MIDIRALDELTQRLSALVPTDLQHAKADLQKNMKSVLQAGLSKLDLVTREEFDVQRAVLLRTREKLEALEAKLQAQIEAQR
jgi:ubiquinone biosynthesis accessory factor UbiK